MQEAGDEIGLAENHHDDEIGAQPGELLHDGYGRGEAMDHTERDQSTASGGCDTWRYVLRCQSLSAMKSSANGVLLRL